MIYLDDLRNATGGQLFGEIAAQEFAGFCYEPKAVQPGDLFVVLRTETQNGHQAIIEAIGHGATGILCEQPPNTTVSGLTVILVGNTVAAIGQWVAYVLRQYQTLVIAIVGELGKSVTASCITAVLNSEIAVHYTPNQIGGIEGLAQSLGRLGRQHQIAIVEISARRKDELASLLGYVHPTVIVVMWLGEHLQETRPNADQLAFEAAAITKALSAQGRIVINLHNPLADSLTSSMPTSVLTVSSADDDQSSAEIVALNVEYFIDKVSFDLKHGTEKFQRNWTPVLGQVGLEATLAALAVALLFEVPIQKALDAIKLLQPQPGHLLLLEGLDKTFLIDNSGVESPASTMAALRYLQVLDLPDARHIVVLGDVEGSNSIYRQIGREAANGADLLFTLGDRAMLAAQAAYDERMPLERIIPLFRHADVINAVRAATKSGDVVLITGAPSARMRRVTSGLLKQANDAPWLASNEPYKLRRPESSSWIELDLDGLAYNVSQLKARVGSDVKVIAVVKANAYGHGAVEVASTSLQNGAELLAVAHTEEGLHLRKAGFHDPILVLGAFSAATLTEAIQSSLTLSIWDRRSAHLAASAANELQQQVSIHIRVDTGYGDYGIPVSDVAPLVRELVKSEGVRIDGLYTDFAASDNLFEAAASHEQIDRFQGVLTSLKAAGINIPYVHAANSCAILTLPSSYFSAVRAGIIIYGLHPSVDVSVPAGFRRVLSWKTMIAQIKIISAGVAVGYGGGYRAEQEMKIAILPIGYADGFRAEPRNWGEVLVGGKRARLVGRVGMDRCAIDVTGLPNISVGQEVVLIGKQGGEHITVEDVARRLDCTNYEVVASISPLLPRIPSWSVE